MQTTVTEAFVQGDTMTLFTDAQLDVVSAKLELTRREDEVFRLLVTTGMSEKRMAKRLSLSRHTVHSHVIRVYAKADVHSRVQLITRSARAAG